jgi:hypothetical protein
MLPVPHPDGGAPPCEECGAAITGGALECPKCGYIQQGGAPPEPEADALLRQKIEMVLRARGCTCRNCLPRDVDEIIAVVRAASRPGT